MKHALVLFGSDQVSHFLSSGEIDPDELGGFEVFSFETEKEVEAFTRGLMHGDTQDSYLLIEGVTAEVTLRPTAFFDDEGTRWDTFVVTAVNNLAAAVWAMNQYGSLSLTGPLGDYSLEVEEEEPEKVSSEMDDGMLLGWNPPYGLI